MPEIRPFRALRYSAEAVPDLRAVVSPPYDVISPQERQRLVDRDAHNVIRLELPVEERGDEPDDRYRRAARTLAAWRSDGTFRKDPRPSLYVYEQVYEVPGSATRTQRGFFARLRLEPLGPGGGGVLPHERTLDAPREDRYKLLRATGANLSPVVVLQDDRSGKTSTLLATLTATPPAVDITTDDGVRHRLWAVPLLPDAEEDPVSELCSLAAQGPVTIADGHHRYETALRYRDERRMSRSCEEDPAFDYLMALILDVGQPLTVLPTHRVIVGPEPADAAPMIGALGELFEVESVATAAELVARMTGGERPADGGRFGLVTPDGACLLRARREAFEPWLPRGGDALRGLDVSLLGVALERLWGIDAAAVAGGQRVRYTKSADEAATAASAGLDGAVAAILLDATPVESIIAVARAGDVMPQKSTYFHPKPLTGLVINPHEW